MRRLFITCYIGAICFLVVYSFSLGEVLMMQSSITNPTGTYIIYIEKGTYGEDKYLCIDDIKSANELFDYIKQVRIKKLLYRPKVFSYSFDYDEKGSYVLEFYNKEEEELITIKIMNKDYIRVGLEIYRIADNYDDKFIHRYIMENGVVREKRNISRGK